MAVWNRRSNRKPTGGRYRHSRGKRRREVGREKQFTFLGKGKVKIYRTRGGGRKLRTLSAELANVTDRKTGKTKSVKIITVKQNLANPNYVQRNIMNKGAVIQTEAGLAVITSRPGQHGAVNAVLIEENSAQVR
ncbi:MAG: 30S ribosomal protein S8e [Methanomassiliicoccales archaeon]